MAAGDYTVVQPGLKTNGGDGTDRQLYLRIFSGEVLRVFKNATIMEPLVNVRTIPNGKSATFPVVGTATASYHTPGTMINGQSISHGELEIFVDSVLVSSAFIANIDAAMAHYDIRSIYADEIGNALAQKLDKTALQVLLLAARKTTNNLGAARTAALIKNPSYATDADSLRAAFFTAAKTFDQKNVSIADRNCVMLPAQYYLLAQNTTIFNRDYGVGAGNYATVALPPVAGISCRMSNNIPTGVVNADSNEKNTYNGDFTNCVGVFFQKGATGIVKLMDLATETEYSVRNQGTLLVAKYCLGHGILQPDAAIELSLAP